MISGLGASGSRGSRSGGSNSSLASIATHPTGAGYLLYLSKIASADPCPPVRTCRLMHHILGQCVQCVKTGTGLLPLKQLHHHELQGISQDGCQAMTELIPHQVLSLVCDLVQVGTANNYNGLMDSQHVLLHRFSLLLCNLI